MELIKKSTSSRPYLPNSSLTLTRVAAAISSNLAGRSSIAMLSVPSRSVMRETIKSLRKEATSSVVYLPCVPTKVFTSRLASVTRNEYLPKLRRRTMPKSLSRTVIGWRVPHF